MGTREPINGKFPFVQHVLVCTGPRCTDAKHGMDGGEGIRAMLKDHNRALGRKPLVRVCGVSCLDMCDVGPNLVEWPGGRVWTRLDRERALLAYEEATGDLDGVR